VASPGLYSKARDPPRRRRPHRELIVPIPPQNTDSGISDYYFTYFLSWSVIAERGFRHLQGARSFDSRDGCSKARPISEDGSGPSQHKQGVLFLTRSSRESGELATKVVLLYMVVIKSSSWLEPTLNPL